MHASFQNGSDQTCAAMRLCFQATDMPRCLMFTDSIPHTPFVRINLAKTLNGDQTPE